MITLKRLLLLNELKDIIMPNPSYVFVKNQYNKEF